jgi:hypothetical protein
MPQVSSFLLTLLEFYELQLQHLSLYSVLVVIFIHFCEIFISVRPRFPSFAYSTYCAGLGRG